MRRSVEKSFNAGHGPSRGEKRIDISNSSISTACCVFVCEPIDTALLTDTPVASCIETTSCGQLWEASQHNMDASKNENNDHLVQSSDPQHPANLIPDLCRRFYDLGWVTGTGGGVSAVIRTANVYAQGVQEANSGLICIDVHPERRPYFHCSVRRTKRNDQVR